MPAVIGDQAYHDSHASNELGGHGDPALADDALGKFIEILGLASGGEIDVLLAFFTGARLLSGLRRRWLLSGRGGLGLIGRGVRWVRQTV
jgi:hypothetical protein